MYVCVGAEADAMPAEIGTTARAGPRGPRQGFNGVSVQFFTINSHGWKLI